VKKRPTNPKFRETLWFKKGELDAEAADRAAGSGQELPGAADSLPIEDRYLDDGSIGPEDSASFGLHTGQTQAMARVTEAPPASSDVVSETELIAELRRGRRKYVALIAGGFTAVAAALMIVAL
jgi:hypothetical protein